MIMFLVGIGVIVGTLNLFMISSRFLHVLIGLEQLNALLLLCSLFVSQYCHTYYVTFLVVFTLEAVVSLSVLTRVWSGGGLIGVSCW